MVKIKTPEQIEIMRQSGKIAARVLVELAQAVKPGIKTSELDSLAEKIILESGAKPSFKGFQGFPAATCISVNDEIVHGIPGPRVLAEGDIVGIDVGVYFKGFHSDTAITVGVGKISDQAQKLIDVTRKSLENGLAQIKANAFLGDAQAEIQKTIESAGFGVIRDLSGHGVGEDLQEAPSIPNFGQKGKGLLLKEGMTLAIEPMVSKGDWHVEVLADNWTVITADGSLAAHFEHTIVVTKNGFEILTKL